MRLCVLIEFWGWQEPEHSAGSHMPSMQGREEITLLLAETPGGL